MKKADILAQLPTLGLTQEVSQTVQQELSAYPEELTPEHMQRFDAFLAEIQMSEIEDAQHIERLAQVLEDSGAKMDQAVEDFTYDSMKAMKTGLSQAQDLAKMVDSAQ